MLHMEARRRAFGETVSDLLWRADKVCHLSTLCLIYRGIPADPISGSAFSEECVTKAHEALEEHQQCIVLLRKVEPHVVELYMQWYVSYPSSSSSVTDGEIGVVSGQSFAHPLCRSLSSSVASSRLATQSMPPSSARSSRHSSSCPWAACPQRTGSS